MESDTKLIQLFRSQAHRAIYPALSQVEGYWYGLCKDAPLPYRSDIDPRALDGALEFAFVLERVAPGVCRFRVAGQHLNELTGLDVRGMPISAMFAPDGRVEISRIVETICSEPCIKEVFLKSGRQIGRGLMTGKMFIAPLLDGAGQVTRILGCLQTKGTIGRTPRRFSVAEVYTKQLDNPGSNSRGKYPPHRQVAFAEGAAEFHHAPDQTGKPSAAIPALTLVIDNS